MLPASSNSENNCHTVSLTHYRPFTFSGSTNYPSYFTLEGNRLPANIVSAENTGMFKKLLKQVDIYAMFGKA